MRQVREAGGHATFAFLLRLQCSLHLVSGRSTPSVSSSETWCRKPSCGETETIMRPSASRIGWRSCRFQSRKVRGWPLKAASEKSGPLMKSNSRLGVAGVGARCGFADHAGSGPGLHVERRHMPRVQFDKAVLQLDRAPLVLRGIPTGRHQAGGARNRPRVPGAIGQIGGEDFALVGRDQNVISRRLLGQHGHLTLDQCHAAVGAPRAAGVFKRSFLHDLGAKTRGCAPQRVGIKLVLVMRADHQEPALPLLPHQILGEPIRQHRTRRRDMDDIGATVLLAQAVIDRSGVQQHGAVVAQRVGGLEQLIRGQIRDDEAVTVGERAAALATSSPSLSRISSSEKC